MSNYRRAAQPGGKYFFTVVTFARRQILTAESNRQSLREAIETTCRGYPFGSIAWVLLPEHLHCVWQLPEGDCDFSLRWQLIKRRFVPANDVEALADGRRLGSSRRRRRERDVWQRRFWEHLIRDDDDLRRHVEYIHYNPVKHGLVKRPADWPYSTFHRYVRLGLYPADWGWYEKPGVAALDLELPRRRKSL